MILKTRNINFQKIIVNLIEGAKSRGQFIFKVNEIDGANKSLSDQSKSVPNVPGIYFLFCENANIENDHTFKINGINHTLLYFGKAGQNKDGALTNQKLRGRINNVTSDSTRNLKDIKRGVYWELILKELNTEYFRIIWIETNENCVKDEGSIYATLKKDGIEYPYLNKKLGKKPQ